MMKTLTTTTMSSPTLLSSSSSSRATRLLKLQSAKKKNKTSFFKQPRVLVLSSSSSSSRDEETNNNNKAAMMASSLAAAMIVFASFSSTAFAGTTTTTRFAGSFADPNHPGCPREITPSGLLRGYDPVPFEKGRGCRGRKIVTDDVFDYPGKTMRYWELKTKINKSDDEIFIDFDKKDGSGEKVTAKLNSKGEIVFPTGEVWKRRRGESFFP
jgi:hypothetical protein